MEVMFRYHRSGVISSLWMRTRQTWPNIYQSIMYMDKELPEQYELVTGDGFHDSADARSTKREIVKLMGSHEEADTRLILHSCDAAVNEGYQRVVVIWRDTNMMLLLVHFLFRISKEVWMISGTAKSIKCFPIHIATEKLTQPVRENFLSFHALTGCDTIYAFRGFGKKSC